MPDSKCEVGKKTLVPEGILGKEDDANKGLIFSEDLLNVAPTSPPPGSSPGRVRKIGWKVAIMRLGSDDVILAVKINKVDNIARN